MQSVSAASPVFEEKRRLRAELRGLRRALDASALTRAACALRDAAAGIGALTGVRSLAGYAACDGEIDVAAVLADADRAGAVILLPRRAPPGLLELVATGAMDRECMATGSGGGLEPIGAACEVGALAVPAVLLAPAVALDRRGYRLGRGGGDYDRLLPVLRALGWTIVGVCHTALLRDTLPTEPHDQPVDLILTDAGLVLPRP